MAYALRTPVFFRRRGMGDDINPTPQECAHPPSVGAWFDPFWWGRCLKMDYNAIVGNSGPTPPGAFRSLNPILYSDYKTPPPPPPNDIALVSASEASGNPDAVYAGVDASGARVYAIPETATANMDRYRDMLAAFYAEQADRTPVDDPCSHWYSILNSEFPSSIGNMLLVAAAVVGGVLIIPPLLSGGGRR